MYFFIKSTVCVSLLFVFYKLFLERQKMHQFNRFYLLAMLLMAIIFPNLKIYMESPIENISNISTIQNNTYFTYFFYLYIIVTSFLLVRFIKSLVTILKRIFKNKHIKKYKNVSLILLDEKILPHTFLSYVFLNKEDYKSKNIAQELYTHEYTHAIQKHTIDVLFTELFQIVFWFNPLTHLITKAIKLNHEFIADECVIATHKNQYSYQNMLLDLATFHKSNILTSNVNYSLTKQRFLMMNKRTSSVLKRIIQITVVPLFTLVFLLIADITTNKEEHHHNEEHRSYTESSLKEHE